MSILFKAVSLAVAGVLWCAAPILAQAPSRRRSSAGLPSETSAIEFSPLSPLVRIYAVQYARRFAEKNELLLGGAYVNIRYDEGQSHAPTFIMGYRRYLWKKAHIEYQLWPSYNWYYENQEKRYYEGAELWNEFRPGYTFDFRLGTRPSS